MYLILWNILLFFVVIFFEVGNFEILIVCKKVDVFVLKVNIIVFFDMFWIFYEVFYLRNDLKGLVFKGIEVLYCYVGF